MTLHDSNIAPDAYFARHPVPLALEYEAARKARAARLSAKVREASVPLLATPPQANPPTQSKTLQVVYEPMATQFQAAAKEWRALIGLCPLDILRAVSVHYGVTIANLCSDRRFGEFVHARGVAAYLIHKMLRKSRPEIGRILGGRDHSTVLFHLRKMDARVRSDEAFAEEMGMLERKIREVTQCAS